MTERRKHWDEDLIESVRFWVPDTDSVIFGVIAAVEDWFKQNAHMPEVRETCAQAEARNSQIPPLIRHQIDNLFSIVDVQRRKIEVLQTEVADLERLPRLKKRREMQSQINTLIALLREAGDRLDTLEMRANNDQGDAPEWTL